jgi:hypothetical protein
MPRRSIRSLSLGVLLLAPTAGAVEPSPRVVLELTRGEGTEACIDAPALERAVERRLKHPVFAHGAPASLRVAVTLGRSPSGGWSATLGLRSNAGAELGARELDTAAKHCSALDDPLVLVVALLVDSPEAREEASKAAETTPATSASLPPKPTPPAGHTTALEIPADTFAPREPWHVDLAASGATEVGTLPGVALGGDLSLGVRPPHFIELRLAGAVLPANVAHTSADRGGRFWLALAGLSACLLEAERGPMRLTGCVSQRVGRLGAAGFGFRATERASELYYSLGATLAGTWWFAAPLGLRLALEANAPLARNAYIALGPGGERRQIFRPSPVTGAALVGLALSLR